MIIFSPTLKKAGKCMHFTPFWVSPVVQSGVNSPLFALTVVGGDLQ